MNDQILNRVNYMIESIQRSVDTTGFSIVNSLISDTQIARAHSWLMGATAWGTSAPSSLQPQYESHLADEHIQQLRKVRRLFWHDKHFWESWCWQSGLFDLVSGLLNHQATLINHAAFIKQPGGSAVVPHQDQALWPFDYPDAISCWIALTPATTDNGCMRVWPESHHLKQLDHREQFGDGWHHGCDTSALHQHSIPVSLQTGDALIWHRHLVHSSPANDSNTNRIGMVFVFADRSKTGFKAIDKHAIESSQMQVCL